MIVTPRQTPLQYNFLKIEACEPQLFLLVLLHFFVHFKRRHTTRILCPLLPGIHLLPSVCQENVLFFLFFFCIRSMSYDRWRTTHDVFALYTPGTMPYLSLRQHM